MSTKEECEEDEAMFILDSPSSERNKSHIWDVLSSRIFSKAVVTEGDSTSSFHVLEVAAGAGVHTLHFVEATLQRPPPQLHATSWKNNLRWQPTDPDESCRRSINARTRICTTTTTTTKSDVQSCILPAISLTLNEHGIMEHKSALPKEMDHNNIDLILCINMIHISPWTATVGLMKMASERLKTGGHLFCYGPYKENGTAVSSNLDFDQSLKFRNSLWGVRNLEDVISEAKTNGLDFVEKVEMPANNLSVIYRKL